MPEKLKGCDPVLVERIENEIIDRGEQVTFGDIAGLAFAKKVGTAAMLLAPCV
jgi:hypothetical protein